MLKNTILLEGTLRKSKKDGWIFETYDRKLYRLEDLLPHFSGPEVRLILTELEDVEELQNRLAEASEDDGEG